MFAVEKWDFWSTILGETAGLDDLCDERQEDLGLERPAIHLVEAALIRGPGHHDETGRWFEDVFRRWAAKPGCKLWRSDLCFFSAVGFRTHFLDTLSWFKWRKGYFKRLGMVWTVRVNDVDFTWMMSHRWISPLNWPKMHWAVRVEVVGSWGFHAKWHSREQQLHKVVKVKEASFMDPLDVLYRPHNWVPMFTVSWNHNRRHWRDSFPILHPSQETWRLWRNFSTASGPTFSWAGDPSSMRDLVDAASRQRFIETHTLGMNQFVETCGRRIVPSDNGVFLGFWV